MENAFVWYNGRNPIRSVIYMIFGILGIYMIFGILGFTTSLEIYVLKKST